MKTPKFPCCFWMPAAGLLALLVVTAGLARGQNEDAVFRGGRVGWARLRTPDAYWERHSESDHRLSTFIRRETSLNMDPTWYSVDVDELEEMCRYPFIFANSLAAVKSPDARRNLAEYFKRGGFIVIDACINKTINRSPGKFLENNKEVLSALIPGCEIKPLSSDHGLYSCCFSMTEKPPHTYHEAKYDPEWARHGLYGVFVGERIVSVITLSGLQCGWSGVRARSPNHGQECMKMMLNIYVYAMTH